MPTPDAGVAPRRSTATGLGRALVATYAVFALAATARSAVQLLTHASEAPLAYALSAVAAVVYILATLGLAEVSPRPRALAWGAVGFELVGVLTVGTLTVLDPELFPDATVWSAYGQGYGYLPLVLPFLGIAWLLRTRPRG
jgi:cytochrome bd-type quinol oxidase subunit 2